MAKSVCFYTLSLVEPKEIEFNAGQFLQIKLEGFTDKKGNQLWKPYSICSSPSVKDKIELVVDVSPHGPGSDYFEKLQIGDAVTGKGPFGVFTVGEEAKELVFIATGSGIAPIRGMIRDLFHKSREENKPHPILPLKGEGTYKEKGIVDQRKMSLYFGVRYPEDVYFFEEFGNLAKENPNFTFFGTVSRPHDLWTGLKGRVTDHLEKMDSYGNKEYYLCGSPAVVDALKIFLVSSGVSEEKVHYEQY